MSGKQVFNLPDVGEGLTEAELVSWQVAVGDEIALNQVVCEIETAKSLVELPSPFAGRITDLLAQPGDTVSVGAPIMQVAAAGAILEGNSQAADSSVADGSVAAQAAPETVGAVVAGATGGAAAAAELTHSDLAQQSVTDADVAVSEPKKNAVLVGYGTAGAVKSRRRGGAKVAARDKVTAETTAAQGGAAMAVLSTAQNSVPAAQAPVAAQGTPAQQPTTPVQSVSQAQQIGAARVLAKPPVRKLAKDLGIDITAVVGTGSIGDISRDDVIRYTNSARGSTSAARVGITEVLERETVIPVKGIRKQIAKAMSQSAFTAPHVSVFTEVDATRTMEYVKRLKNSSDFAGVRVSPLLVFAKAMIWAVRRNPLVNATFTEHEITMHNYVNLGIAAATPRGLLVPNIKDAQNMSMLELAKAIGELTSTAREGKTTPAEMANGTITVTNIGVFGMDTGTPIINPGESAIVVMGTIKQKPWVVDGAIVPRMVTTVGGSFDHRVVDGDVISAFVADVAVILEEPALLLD
ncbi:2-oxo acid dehydrogenase subunit E2 [Canibacter sp. lx-72]|uniref:dihydrolipoamide acetyltransferase family protein n=1 Tax=Canibacter zhuwentaonis TaxID=2837491 RepID=UPI001BDBC66E|nr:dihydrolipoamide acetyltransferase family protein [Canibacter zhuwentaonis]MBT1018055.1 2-oxo acid dehydrogenase subunit E2 [Canibacter zhuwentaonis]